jgi:hypothetical protein
MGYNEYQAKLQRLEADYNDEKLKEKNAHKKDLQTNKDEYENKIKNLEKEKKEE